MTGEREVRRVKRDDLDAEQKRIARSGNERLYSAVAIWQDDQIVEFEVIVEKIEPRMETR